MAAAPCPAWGSCDLSLIYPLARLKLPVLAASTSLRRSRKAGAACRDKSKGPRSGDFAGRSPGVQGAAATGRPLCAPGAIRDITQKINRERNLPGINIEVVALPNIVRTGTFPVVPLFRRVAAAPYPAYNDCRAIRLGRRLNPARRRCRQTPAAPDASWHSPPAAHSTAQSA